MVQLFYWCYSQLTTNLLCFQFEFKLFTAQLQSFSCPYNNLVAIFDGCFIATCRPGGNWCKGLNLWDHQTFAGKERLDWLKYQACVFPNGMLRVGG